MSGGPFSSSSKTCALECFHQKGLLSTSVAPLELPHFLKALISLFYETKTERDRRRASTKHWASTSTL